MVTVTALAAHLGITEADPRYGELEGVYAATVEHVECIVGPLSGATLRAPIHGRTLILPATRLAAVVAVTDPAGVTVPVGDCDVDLAAGLVTVPAGRARAGTWLVQVTPRASAAVDEAIMIIAKHLWETRRGRAGRDAAFAQPEDVVPVGFAVPRRAAELLGASTVPGFA